MKTDAPRIAFFMPAIDRGGIASALSRIGEALAANKAIQIDIVTGTHDPKAAERFEKFAKVVPLNNLGLVPGIGPLRVEKTRMTISTLWGLSRYLRREKPDALITFQGAVSAVVAAKLARFNGRLLIRESNTPSLALRFPKPYLAPLKRLIKAWSTRRADKVIAISRGAKQDIAEYLGVSPDRIVVIYNPIEHEQSTQERHNPGAVHPWLEADLETPVVATVGRLTYQKGVDTVIRAVAEIRKERAIRLIVVGDGGDRSMLERLAVSLGIQADVHFTGWVAHPNQYVEHADVFAFGTRYEGLGNALLETLAVGTPIVSCDAPNGPRDVLDDGKCGLLVPVDDYLAMAKAMTRYLDEPELVEEHRRHGQDHLAMFSPEHIAAQYFEALGITDQ